MLNTWVLDRLVFRSALPTLLTVGDVIAEIRAYPSVSIVNNTIRNNRARGLLLNTRGRTVVANNYFHTSGASEPSWRRAAALRTLVQVVWLMESTDVGGTRLALLATTLVRLS